MIEISIKEKTKLFVTNHFSSLFYNTTLSIIFIQFMYKQLSKNDEDKGAI